MENNKLLPLSIIILAINFVFGSIWIGNSIEKASELEGYDHIAFRALLNKEEAAQYLNISVEQLNSILRKDEQQKRNLGSYPTYRFIPYMELEGNQMFNIEGLNLWIEWNMINN